MLSFALLKRFFKILPISCSGSLLRMCYYIRNCFKASFPTAYFPEYSRGLTKRKSRPKNDPIPLPFTPRN